MKLAKAFAEVDASRREPAATTVKGFMTIGSIGKIGEVVVVAYEVLVKSQELAFHGVRFDVSDGDEYGMPSTVTVAASNAEKLVDSLEVLANAKINTSRFAHMEIESVVEDLRVVVFNADNGSIHAAVEAVGTTCHIKQSELLDLRKLVMMAIEHLRSHGAQF